MKGELVLLIEGFIFQSRESYSDSVSESPWAWA